MKPLLMIMMISFLMYTGVRAQDLDADSVSGLQTNQEEISRKMDDLIRSEALLRDRQTARIMRLEEDIAGLRQRYEQSLAETEHSIAQEQALFRDYIQIINSTLKDLNEDLKDKETRLMTLDSNLKNISQDVSAFKDLQEKSRQRTDQALKLAQQAHEKIQSLSDEIPGILEEFSVSLSEMDDMTDLEEDIAELGREASQAWSRLEEVSSRLDQELSDRQKALDEIETTLRREIENLSHRISTADEGVVERVNAVETRIQYLDQHLEQREILAAGAGLGLGVLVLLTLLIGSGARRKARKMEVGLQQARTELSFKIEEQAALLDTRLMKLLERQISLLPENQEDLPSEKTRDDFSPPDHDLAIALGEEIYRIMKRSKEPSEKIRLHEEFKASLRRLWTLFREKGYEVVDLEGMKYQEDMEARAEFILTHELLPGEQVVSRVIKPLIKYHGETIQEAEIEVMTGE